MERRQGMSAAGVLFVIAWLLCGCCIDGMLDDWRLCVIAGCALIVAIRSAFVLSRRELIE